MSDCFFSQGSRIKYTGSPLGVDYMLGPALKREREKAGLTQQQFAILAHTTPWQIALYEAGLLDMSISRLVELANLLNISPAEFFEEQN